MLHGARIAFRTLSLGSAGFMPKGSSSWMGLDACSAAGMIAAALPSPARKRGGVAAFAITPVLIACLLASSKTVFATVPS
jgi:hypothetical protein